MRIARVRRVAAGLGAAAMLTGDVAGQAIPIANAGFEAQAQPPNTFAVLNPSGWQRYDPGLIVDNGVDAIGVLNPSNSTFFVGDAPEGTTAALVYLEGDRGTTHVGLAQSVPAVLQGRFGYRLSVQVGNIASGFGPPNNRYYDLRGFPGYAIQLLAGGVVVAEDFNSLGASIPEGEWRLSTVELAVGAAHPNLGQQLRVRIVNLNIAGPPEAPGIEVDFDDVRLERVPFCEVCRADWNCMDGLDSQDFFDYLDEFLEGDADFNGADGTDSQDFFEFLDAFFGGC